MVVVGQFFDGDVAADGDVGNEAQVVFVQHVVQGLNNALDARVVGCHAVTDEAEWCWHLLEEVDVNVQLFVVDQQVGCVDAGWSGADYGHAQGHEVCPFVICIVTNIADRQVGLLIGAILALHHSTTWQGTGKE